MTSHVSEPTIEQDLVFLKAERHCCTDCVRRAADRIAASVTILTRERDEAVAATPDLIAKAQAWATRCLEAETREAELRERVRELGGEL